MANGEVCPIIHRPPFAGDQAVSLALSRSLLALSELGRGLESPEEPQAVYYNERHGVTEI